MQLELHLNKSIEENAGLYFNKAKKAKKKLQGAKDALKQSQKTLEKLQKEEEKFWEQEQQKQAKKQRKQEWYQKFHWFISSEGFLCIGGKDSTSNEIIIKKHLEKNDLVFHTEIPGSPFFIIKNGHEAGEPTQQEAAQATAAYSKAWKLGLGSTEVYAIKPEQVSKTAKSGESMGKGAFMIYGKRNYFNPQISYTIGLVEEEIIGGPLSAVKSKTNNFIIVITGRYKKSDLAKKIKAKLKGGDTDDIIKFLPSGGGDIKR